MSCNGSCSSCSSAGSCSTDQKERMQNPEEQKIANTLSKIKHKIVVMSGKGGVGKSTVSATLALALCAKGYRTGLLDVDLHGPSLAGILGLTGQTIQAAGDKMAPLAAANGLKVMTIQSLLQNRDDAVIWRGPMKVSAIRQFLSETDWGELDFLLIDSPPGTGDELLTVAQTIEDCKALVVTTPQEVALADVRKSLNFCQQIEMPIVGLVENMSGFVCPSCGQKHDIFKSGGGAKTAEAYKIPFLGGLPIDPSVVEGGDAGLQLDKLNAATKQSFEEVVAALLNNISAMNV